MRRISGHTYNSHWLKFVIQGGAGSGRVGSGRVGSGLGPVPYSSLLGFKPSKQPKIKW